MEKESFKVSTSTDDDPGGNQKPDLDCVIGASLVDDLGASGAILDRIIRFYWSRHCRWINDRPMGRIQNLHPVQMARKEASQSRIGVPALSRNS